MAVLLVMPLLLCFAFTWQQDPQGKTLYEKNCARCHGTIGTRHLFGAKDLQKSKLEDTPALRIITEGRRLMPAYRKKLSASEIEQVLSYIKTFRK